MLCRCTYRNFWVNQRSERSLSLSQQSLEFRMRFDNVARERANHIDAQRVFFGVLKRGGHQFEANPLPPKSLGDFRVPDRHPAVTICFKLEVSPLPFLPDSTP